MSTPQPPHGVPQQPQPGGAPFPQQPPVEQQPPAQQQPQVQQQGQQVPQYPGQPQPGAQPAGQPGWGQQPGGAGQPGAYGYPAPGTGNGWQYGAAQQPAQQAAGPTDDTGRPLAVIIAVWAVIAGLRTLIAYPITMVQNWTVYGGYESISRGIFIETWNFLGLLDAAALVAVGVLLFARRHKARLFAVATTVLAAVLYVGESIDRFVWSSEYIDSFYNYFYEWMWLSAYLFYLIPAVFALLPGISRTLRKKPKQQQPPQQPVYGQQPGH